MKKAFTLIETLIGVTLVTVVMTAVAALILSTNGAGQRNVHLLQANALAQETLEVMRYVRDSNHLQNYAWDGGSDQWNGDFSVEEGDVLQFYITDASCSHLWCFSSQPEDGVVENRQGVPFSRSVQIQSVPEQEGAIEVTATVEWQEKGKEESLLLSTYLSDWQ